MNLTPNGVSRLLPRRIVVESEPTEANSACCYGEGRPVDGLSTNRRLILSIRAANLSMAARRMPARRNAGATGAAGHTRTSKLEGVGYQTLACQWNSYLSGQHRPILLNSCSHSHPEQANETGGVPCLHRRALPPSASMQASTLRQDLATACLPALAHFCDTERLGAVRQGSSRLGRARLGMARKGTSRHGRAWIRFCGNDW